MSREQRADWLKGTLPAWIATGLIAVLCFVGVRYLDHVNQKLDQVDANRFILNNHASDLIALKDTVNELKNGQRDVLNELRNINTTLRKQ